MIRRDITVSAVLVRSTNALDAYQYRLLLREVGDGRRRSFTVVMTGEQFAGVMTALVTDGVTMEIRESLTTVTKEIAIRDAAENALKALTWIQESNPDGDASDRKVLDTAIAKLKDALE